MTHMMHSCPVCNGRATDATVDDDDDDDDAETSSRTCPTVERSGPCQSCRTLIISWVRTTRSWRAFISLMRAATAFIDSTAAKMTS